jgi:hypothetical protein
MSTGLDLRIDRPNLVHQLLVAVRFHDVFLGPEAPVRVPLAVSIDALGWQAYPSPHDATYRFLRTNAAFPSVPPPPWDVTVSAPGGEYVNFAPFQVQPISPPVLPPTPAAYLVERPLWPTRSFRPPPGETVVLGRVVRVAPAPVAGLEVWLFPEATRQPTTPSTFTDANGAFVFRLPGLRGTSQPGPPPVVTLPSDVGIEVRDGATLLTAAGQRIGIDLGKIESVNLNL